jgi:hypothetical protein
VSSDDLPLIPKPQGPLDVSAEMVMEIACGLEDPIVIANRHGYSSQEFGALCQWEPFNQAVEQKKQELKASGHTFRLMTGWMAEDLAKDLYRRAKGTEASLPQVHEVFKTMAKLADLEPKATAATAGPGFSISINFTKPAEPVVDVQAKELPND